VTFFARGPVRYAVSDRRRLAPDARTTADEIRALEEWIDALGAAGVQAVQIRERDLAARRLAAVVAHAVRVVGDQTTVIVNDRADVAIACGAGGVHLRADGPPAARVRALGAGLVLGRSIHAAAEAVAAQDADYLLFGPVFETASKPGVAAAGLDVLREVVQSSARPIIAIGGITGANAQACLDAGAAGVAGIGWFL
jgi:thiamine-phosphate diphosphorylase